MEIKGALFQTSSNLNTVGIHSTIDLNTMYKFSSFFINSNLFHSNL